MKPARNLSRECRLRAHRSPWTALAAVLGALCVPSAEAATYWVGSGAGCTHATLDSAIAAAQANGTSPDFIRLAGAVTLGDLIEITNDTLFVEGGYSVCGGPAGTSRTSIDVPGAHDAFWIHGASPALLRLHNVRVEMGPAAGRILRLEEHGWAQVTNSELLNGQAAAGGNVWMSGADTQLTVESSSRIALGTATSGNGGGIYCEAGGKVIFQYQSFLTQNTAFLSGGGLYLDSCELYWTSYNTATGETPAVSEIAENIALHGDGGGVAALAGSYISATGTHPAVPASLAGNLAGDGGRGGGAYLAGPGTQAFFANAHFYDNTANGPGGALYVEAGAIAEVELLPTYCSLGRGCSEISLNRSQTSYGGGVFVGAGGQTWIRRTTLTGNYTVTASSAAALGALGAGALLVVEGCEIYDNDPNLAAGVESPQIAAGSSASLTVAFSTIVEQTAAPGMAVFENANATTMRLLSSVVQAPRTFTAPPPPATQVHCVIVKETASLPAGAQSVVLVTDPSLIFRLSTPEDYSIFRHSEAQDFCDTSQWDPWSSDIEGQDRGYDDPTFIDILGPFDIGADEWRPEIFADGFESGTLIGW